MQAREPERLTDLALVGRIGLLRADPTVRKRCHATTRPDAGAILAALRDETYARDRNRNRHHKRSLRKRIQARSCSTAGQGSSVFDARYGSCSLPPLCVNRSISVSCASDRRTATVSWRFRLSTLKARFSEAGACF